MTVQSTTARADYTGNGSTTAFTVPFYFLDATHLVVYRTQISTGVVTTLALTTDYTVAGAGVPAGGTVTAVVAPTTDQKISILRNVPHTQLTHYVPNDPFPAASHEQALDHLTMEMQQVQEQIDRAVKVGVTDTGTTPDQLLASINTSVNTCVTQASAASASATASASSATASATSASQALAAVASAAAAMRNKIINGDMAIDQRNNGSAVTAAFNSFGTFPVDRFSLNNGRTNGTTLVGVRDTSSPTGHLYNLKVTNTTGGVSAASDNVSIQHAIEGLNLADLLYGTANAKTVTVQFWVKASIAGAYAVAFRNGVPNRSYVTTVTVNSANTWEFKTIVVPGDTSGTWALSSAAGLYLTFDLGVGSTYNTSTLNAWQTGSFMGYASGVKLSATTGATFQVGGLQYELGSTATPFEYRNYGLELALCQRYFQMLTGETGMAVSTSAAKIGGVLPVQMRAAPSVGTPATAVIVTDNAADYTQTVTGATLTDATSASVYVTALNLSPASMTVFRPCAMKSTSGSIPLSAEIS